MNILALKKREKKIPKLDERKKFFKCVTVSQNLQKLLQV